MPNLAQIGVGLTQRRQQLVRGLIQAGVGIFGLKSVDHDSVCYGGVRHSTLRSNCDGGILVPEHPPVVRIRNLEIAVAEITHVAAGLDAAGGSIHSWRLAFCNLLRRKRLHVSDALLDVAELRAVAAIAGLPGES